MDIMVRLRSSVASELHGEQSASEDTAELVDTIRHMGLTLEPIHPGTDDPLLAPYFRVAVDDPSQSPRVINRLLRLNAVEAAYEKPADELP